MLCPKCGYISFDDRVACEKCSNDLSSLVSELNGTTVQVDLEHYLGSGLKADDVAVSEELLDAELPQEDTAEPADDFSVPEVEIDESELVMPDIDLDQQEIVLEEELETSTDEATVDLSGEEDSELELGDLDVEQPDGLDLADKEIAESIEELDLEEGKIKTSSDETESEITLELDLEEVTPEEGGTQEEKDVAAQAAEEEPQDELEGIELEIEDLAPAVETVVDEERSEQETELVMDLSSSEVSNEKVEESPTADLEPVQDAEDEQLTVDLEEIDLSDLVHEQDAQVETSESPEASVEEPDTEQNKEQSLEQDELTLELDDDDHESITVPDLDKATNADFELETHEDEDDGHSEITGLDSMDSAPEEEPQLELSLETDDGTKKESLPEIDDIIDLSLDDD